MIQINEKRILIAYSVIIIAILLWVGPGTLFAHRISHPFPVGYLASDSFQHQTRAESIKEMGNYRHEADYIVTGKKGVVGFYPPLLYHSGIALSQAAGLETYDGVYLLVFLAVVIAVMLNYFLIKELFGIKVAFLSVPLLFFLFHPKIYPAFTWNHWPALLGLSSIIFIIWGFAKTMKKPGYWPFLSIGIMGTALAHSSEFIFSLVILSVLIAYEAYKKSLTKKHVKAFAYAIIIALIVAAYYLQIFWLTWGQAQKITLRISFKPDGWMPGGFKPVYFREALIFLVIGLVLATWKSIKKDNFYAPLALTVILLGFTNIIGAGFRAYQLRFFWPVFLSASLGLGIYTLLRLIIKKKGRSDVIVYALIGLVLSVYAANAYATRIGPSSLMDAPHWQLYQWISRNTEKNSWIYFFYGDSYYQDAILRNSKRDHYLAELNELVRDAKSGEVKKEYWTRMAGDSGPGLPVRDGLGFRFVFNSSSYHHNVSLCEPDYYVFDRAGRFRPLLQYNMAIAGFLKNKSVAKIVYKNPSSIVMKRIVDKRECIRRIS